MNKHIAENKTRIKDNRSEIRENKIAIEDLKRNAVPYLVFESTLGRSDRIIHRLIIALILALAILFTSNAVWLYTWSHYKQAADTTVINKDGVSNFIGEGGDINNDKG